MVYDLTRTAASKPGRRKNKWNATTGPVGTDDSGDGYEVGSRWVDTTNDKSYEAVDVSSGAAVWVQTGGSGSGDNSLLVDTSVSGAHTADRDDGATHDLTLTGNATITPDATTVTAGDAIDLRLLIRQDGTGSRTLGWGGTIDWVGGSAPTMPTAANSLLTVGLLSVDDGATWLGYAVEEAGATDHGALTGLSDDDHPQYVRDSELAGLGAVGPILISDDHSTPIVFADILLTEDGDDILYADVG